ncbi:hypothetical protein EBR96_06610, partial [bacterium]|nr:hypothetical protein [bacterium]
MTTTVKTRSSALLPTELDLSYPPLPNSKKGYVPGNLYPELKVPFREITLSDTRGPDGVAKPNS